MSRETLSSDSIAAASRSRAKASAHGGKGKAGVVQDGMDIEGRTLVGEDYVERFHLPQGTTKPINIGISWNNIVMIQAEGMINRLMKKVQKVGVDIDLGCLYELQNGDRGVLQAFGELYGAYDRPPFVHHCGDERTGDKEGFDETMEINAALWSEIKRVLFYCYIYKGPMVWDQIHPEITINIPGMEKPCTLVLEAKDEALSVCALASLENIEGMIEFSAIAEYFHSQASMDRAFGYGIRWERDGAKRDK